MLTHGLTYQQVVEHGGDVQHNRELHHNVHGLLADLQLRTHSDQGQYEHNASVQKSSTTQPFAPTYPSQCATSSTLLSPSFSTRLIQSSLKYPCTVCSETLTSITSRISSARLTTFELWSRRHGSTSGMSAVSALAESWLSSSSTSCALSISASDATPSSRFLIATEGQMKHSKHTRERQRAHATLVYSREAVRRTCGPQQRRNVAHLRHIASAQSPSCITERALFTGAKRPFGFIFKKRESEREREVV